MKTAARLVACALLFLASACTKPIPLNNTSITGLIEASPAFGQIDSGVVFLGTEFRPSPTTKRELLSVEHPTVLNDGPGGIAGQTATAAITWRWTEGPYAGRVFHAHARLNSSSGAWKVYDDYLQKQIWASERGEE